MNDMPFRLIDLFNQLSRGEDVFFRLVHAAQDIMSLQPKSLSLEDTVEAALRFMAANEIRHIPVMDAPARKGRKPSFVGVVSQRDLFRLVSPYWGTTSQLDEDAEALQKRLEEIVTRKPKALSPKTPMTRVLQTMLDEHIDMVPILEGKDLVGVITATDVVKVVVILGKIRGLFAEHEGKTRLVDLLSHSDHVRGHLLSHVAQTVEDIMTEEVTCLGMTNSLAKAMEVMQTGGFRHVPVLDARDRLVGIVSDRDVLLNLPLPGPRSRKAAEVFRAPLFVVDSKDPSRRKRLDEIMKRKVVHVLPSFPIYDAASKLYEEHVSCLPVVDEKGNLRGIVTVTDLMRSMLAIYRLVEKSTG